MIVTKTKDGFAPLADQKKFTGATGASIGRATMQRLAREGRAEELAGYGVFLAEREPVPEGKIATGAERIETRDGKPVVVRNLVDAPPPLPEPTPEEKLAHAGLTAEEFDALVAESLARMGAK